MTKEKRLQYKKAHTELYEIIKNLSDEEKNKIPDEFINNLQKDIDDTYLFHFDKSKTVFEQDLMTETKALLVQIYAKYLAPENEAELWKNYNHICQNELEKKRKENYNPNNIFKSINTVHSTTEEVALVEVKKQSWYYTHLKKLIRKIMTDLSNYLKQMMKISFLKQWHYSKNMVQFNMQEQ